MINTVLKINSIIVRKKHTKPAEQKKEKGSKLPERTLYVAYLDLLFTAFL